MNWLLEKINAFGNRKAIFYKERIISYSELSSLIEHYSSIVTSKIPSKSVTVIISDYTPEAIACFLALSANKNIVVPVTSASLKEQKERIEESYTDVIINLTASSIEISEINDHRPKHNLIKQLQAADASGLVLFSSGSTGKPKAMLHNLDNLLDVYKRDYVKDLNTLIFLTFDHIGGIDTLFRQLAIGAAITIPETRSPEDICKLIEKYRVNVLPASPTFLNLLLISEADKSYDLSSLKIIGYGAEPMPEHLLKRLISVFPNAEIQQKFGTSETSAFRVTSLSPGSLFMKIDDQNVEYKIVDNELWLKSKTQIAGYLNRPIENFTEDGWFKTGDIVETAENGYIKITGRSSDTINVGGEKVLPSEVESVLFKMREIADCMVYAESNAITGQIVAADVVLNEGSNESGIKKKIRSFCNDKLSIFKIPVKINIVSKTNFNERFKKIRRK